MTRESSLTAAYARWRHAELGQITDTLEHRLLLELAGIEPEARVLDIGCGDGALAIQFARLGAMVIGVDADPEMIAVALGRAARQASPSQFVLADAERLPFANCQFDVVVASALLCLVRNRAAVVAQMARVLKPGGRLIVGELGAWSLWNAWRRVRGWFGAAPWRGAHFHTAKGIARMMRAAGLEPGAARGSVYYPPMAAAARLLAPVDAWIGKRLVFGAAFFVMTGRKPIMEDE